MLAETLTGTIVGRKSGYADCWRTHDLFTGTETGWPLWRHCVGRSEAKRRGNLVKLDLRVVRSEG